MTPRQPTLRSARCLIMQAVIFGIFGISELQRRNASPVHCCCASELKAKLAVEETAENEAAKASAKVILRAVLVKKCGHFRLPLARLVGPLLMVGACAWNRAPTVTDITQP